MAGRPAVWLPNPAGPEGARAEFSTCRTSWSAVRASGRGALIARPSDCSRAALHRICANCLWPRGRLVAAE